MGSGSTIDGNLVCHFTYRWNVHFLTQFSCRKNVCLEIYDGIVIRDVNYALRETNDRWFVDVKVYMEGPVSSQEGYLDVNITELLDEPIRHHYMLSSVDGEEFHKTVSFNISRDKVQLWWPNGYGDQKLYTLTATWRPENRDIRSNRVKEVPDIYSLSSKSVRIGFRTIEIVENARDIGKTFFFKVNGVPMFMKGSNWIPSHILPEKSYDADTVEHLLGSAKRAHMNMLRIWGGGLYESDLLYDLADEYGILLWHDMMYACAMYPVFDEFMR